MTIGPGQPVVPQIRTPEDMTAGAYANGVSVWFSPTEFTLDFLVNLPPEPGTDPMGNQVVVAPQQVVARVKMPPPLAYQVMRNIGVSMDQYEAQHGAIPEHQGQHIGTPPVPPTQPPPTGGPDDAE
jgi:hypothetical protein